MILNMRGREFGDEFSYGKLSDHSMLSVMEMRMSLKASQYMMLSRTKVQGKTIRDTRSWRGREGGENGSWKFFFLASSLGTETSSMSGGQTKGGNSLRTHNADSSFPPSLHDLLGVNMALLGLDLRVEEGAL